MGTGRREGGSTFPDPRTDPPAPPWAPSWAVPSLGLKQRLKHPWHTPGNRWGSPALSEAIPDRARCRERRQQAGTGQGPAAPGAIPVPEWSPPRSRCASPAAGRARRERQGAARLGEKQAGRAVRPLSLPGMGPVRLPGSLCPARALLSFSPGPPRRSRAAVAVAPVGCFHDRFLCFINRDCAECKLAGKSRRQPGRRPGLAWPRSPGAVGRRPEAGLLLPAAARPLPLLGAAGPPVQSRRPGEGGGHNLPACWCLPGQRAPAPGEPPRTVLCAAEHPGAVPGGPSIPYELCLPTGPCPARWAARVMCRIGPHPGTVALGTAGAEREQGSVQTPLQSASWARTPPEDRGVPTVAQHSLGPGAASPPPAAPTCPRPRRRPAPSAPYKIKRPSAALLASPGFARCVRSFPVI